MPDDPKKSDVAPPQEPKPEKPDLREVLEIKKIKNDLLNNTIKTATTAIGMFVALGSAISGGIAYFQDMVAQREAAVTAAREARQLKLTEDARNLIGFFAGGSDQATADNQINAAIQLRGLGAPGAAIIRDVIYYAENDKVARTLGTSYADIAFTSPDPDALVMDFINSIDASYRVVRVSLREGDLQSTKRQFIAFQFVLPAFSGENAVDAENMRRVVTMIDDDLKSANNVVCRRAENECLSVQTYIADITSALDAAR